MDDLESKKGKGIFKIVALVVLCATVGGAGFVGGNYYHEKFNTTTKDSPVIEKNDKTSDEEKAQNIDVDSRLVQTLYNKVSTNNAGWNRYWIYEPRNNSNIMTPNREFYTDKADSEIKMQIVGINLRESNKVYIADCDKILDNVSGLKSACAITREGNIFKTQWGYTREYIETLYKEIFGENATLDKSVGIYTSQYSVDAYFYNSELDKYVQYQGEGGGTSGPGGYTSKLTKAIKQGNEIKIFEEITKTQYSSDEVIANTEISTVVYTFKQESDGMYSFVSRVPEK